MSVETGGTSVQQLKSMLIDLHSNPCPYVPNPPQCKKRASVALIIRVRPTFPDIAEYESSQLDGATSLRERLELFFRQPWVQRGDPEVVFIKRAARKGDRWTSHIAFPGGKRDIEDEDDRATSIRETSEEIGLDLTAPYCYCIGSLPQRIVTTAWGTVPLMVLCPFVFLVIKYDLPPLRLQPSEINSAYWVSLRALSAPSLKTYERCDVSDRLSRPSGWLLKAMLRMIFGQMLFAAVRLVPSESLCASSAPDFIPDQQERFMSAIRANLEWLLFDHAASSSPDRPLLLWGLTHGMMADFLNLLPSYGNAKHWVWPSFSSWDIRFIVWLLTYRFRKRKIEELFSTPREAPTIIGEGLGTLGLPNDPKDHDVDKALAESHLNGDLHSNIILFQRPPSGISGHMIEGYWSIVRKAIVIGLLIRCSIGAALISLWFRRTR